MVTGKERAMRLGLFMMPVHPPHRPMHENLAEDLEKSLLADKLGFDEMFLGEHYSASTEPYPSPLMFMASLIPRTSKLAFGTGVLSLPNRHPAIIAGEAAQFDQMSRGRFILGIGTGSLLSDFELLGHGDPALRNRMLVESIDMIEKIWSQDPPYDITGEFWTTHIAETVNTKLGLGVMPKPYQKPRPPICVTAASPHSQTVRLAGRRGWGPISSSFLTEAGLATHWEMLRQGAAEAGKRPSGEAWRLVRCIHVAASDAEARERVMSPESSYRYYFDYMSEILRGLGRLIALKPRPDMPDDEVTVEKIIDSRVIFGSPGTVLDKLAALRDRAGPFGSLLMTGVDWGGPNEAWERQSMKLLAEEVMPRLAQHAAAKAAAE
jgi:alkanesulfonate monooxygenase SsuD/methylene tetrahydromethanopterin reductase-like flavin-dependent oxidoreductase (luciferase family)